MSGTTRVSRYQKGKPERLKPIWIYWSKRENNCKKTWELVNPGLPGKLSLKQNW